MGRRRKYFSDEEKREANNQKVKDFYWRNKEKLDAKAKVYYWKKKIIKLVEDGKIEDAKQFRELAIHDKGLDLEDLVIEEK